MKKYIVVFFIFGLFLAPIFNSASAQTINLGNLTISQLQSWVIFLSQQIVKLQQALAVYQQSSTVGKSDTTTYREIAPAAGGISITYPIGPTIWVPGSQQIVRWTASNTLSPAATVSWKLYANRSTGRYYGSADPVIIQGQAILEDYEVGLGSELASKLFKSFQLPADVVSCRNSQTGCALVATLNDGSNPSATFRIANLSFTPLAATAPATYSLTAQVSPFGTGTIGKRVGSTANVGPYPAGTLVTLTATPTSGYTFTGWNGAFTGVTNPLTLVMNENKTITANFALTTTSATSPTTAVSRSIQYTVKVSGATTVLSGVQLVARDASTGQLAYAITTNSLGQTTTFGLTVGKTYDLEFSKSGYETKIIHLTVPAGSSTYAPSVSLNTLTTSTPPPTSTSPSLVSFTVNGQSGATVNTGAAMTLAWSVGGDTASCGLLQASNDAGNGAWTGTKSFSGTQSVSAPNSLPGGATTATVTYTLRCSGSSGAWNSVTVTVQGSSQATAPAPVAYGLNVSSPPANAVWPTGSSQYVSWFPMGTGSLSTTASTKIELLTSTGNPVSNLGFVTNTGFAWVTAPVTTGNYLVRVTVTSNGVTATDDSEVFSVVSLNLPTVSVTAPNASTAWPVGSTQTLRWTVTGTNNTTGNMGIFLQDENRNPYGLGAHDTFAPNTGSAQVTLPTTPGRYRYYVAGNFGGTVVGGESEVFSITD